MTLGMLAKRTWNLNLPINKRNVKDKILAYESHFCVFSLMCGDCLVVCRVYLKMLALPLRCRPDMSFAVDWAKTIIYLSTFTVCFVTLKSASSLLNNNPYFGFALVDYYALSE